MIDINVDVSHIFKALIGMVVNGALTPLIVRPPRSSVDPVTAVLTVTTMIGWIPNGLVKGHLPRPNYGVGGNEQITSRRGRIVAKLETRT